MPKKSVKANKRKSAKKAAVKKQKAKGKSKKAKAKSGKKKKVRREAKPDPMFALPIPGEDQTEFDLGDEIPEIAEDADNDSDEVFDDEGYF